MKEIQSECYVDFLNCKRNFKKERKEFKTYQNALKWCKNNFERFNPDVIKFY